jgi:anti-anti-sigma factor
VTSANTFEARVSSGDRGPVIELTGTVNKAAKEPLEAAYEEAASVQGEMRLDFRAVDYINSTGIAVIVGLLAKARATGREIGAFGLTDHYREVFEITRLSDFMTIYDDAKSAK